MDNAKVLTPPVGFVAEGQEKAAAYLEAQLEKLRTGSYEPQCGWIHEIKTPPTLGGTSKSKLNGDSARTQPSSEPKKDTTGCGE